MHKLYNDDNLTVTPYLNADLVYADMIYENSDFTWVSRYWNMLRPNGVFIVQTDYHSVAELKLYLDNLQDSRFISWVIYLQEWGGVPKRGFPQKHDDILIYSNGDDFKWYGDRIQIPKATAGTKFDKKGTGLKTPCSVFYDLGNFSTMSKERIKNEEGRNIKWQKPLKLMDRLLLPFTDFGDVIIDPFMGSGTTGVWCIRNNRNFYGVEFDTQIFEIARERLYLEETDIQPESHLGGKL